MPKLKHQKRKIHLENSRKSKLVKNNEAEEFDNDGCDPANDYDDFDGWFDDDYDCSEIIKKDGVNNGILGRDVSSKMDSYPVNDVQRRNDIACKILEQYPDISEELKQDLISGCLPSSPGIDKWVFIRSKIDVEIEGELERDPHGRWHDWFSYYLYYIDNFTL